MFFSTLCFCNTRAGVLPRLGVICLSPQTQSVKVRRGSNAAGRSASCGAHDSPCSELGFAVSCETDRRLCRRSLTPGNRHTRRCPHKIVSFWHLP